MSLARRIVHAYDHTQFASVHHERFYEHSGFSNFGYWLPHTQNGKQAAEELLLHLLKRIPAISPSNILDIACGQGGSTRFLCQRFPKASVIGTNLSPKQIQNARKNAPEAAFVEMDAARLSFADQSFDLIVCIEAAFHFNTREDFLRHALRVLRPGGFVVLSDMLTRLEAFDHALRRLGFPLLIPEGNALALRDYPALLQRLGFCDIQVEDAREFTFKPYRKRFLQSCLKNLGDRSLWPGIFFDPIQIPLLLPWLEYHNLWLDAYALVWAGRPAL